jgi:hypothetical protein
LLEYAETVANHLKKSLATIVVEKKKVYVIGAGKHSEGTV